MLAFIRPVGQNSRSTLNAIQMTPEQEAQYRLLQALEQHPGLSQRDIASTLGISLGRTNYIIRALVEKGFLKVESFAKSPNKVAKAAYLLTPAGIRQRVELTHGYIERKKAEYIALTAELERLRAEAPEAFANTKNNFPGNNA